MWPRRSHTLAPLTKLTSIKKEIKWTKVEQDALWPTILYQLIRIFMKHLKFTPMLARSN